MISLYLYVGIFSVATGIGYMFGRWRWTAFIILILLGLVLIVSAGLSAGRPMSFDVWGFLAGITGFHLGAWVGAGDR